MLALQTGWTPDVLDSLALPFRRACHWALFVRSLVGEQGITDIEVPAGASPEILRQTLKAKAALDRARSALFPEDD